MQRLMLNHPGYLVSSNGRVWSKKTSRLLKPGVNKPGYEYVNLRIDGHTKPIAVHRLVAEAFLNRPGFTGGSIT